MSDCFYYCKILKNPNSFHYGINNALLLPGDIVSLRSMMKKERFESVGQVAINLMGKICLFETRHLELIEHGKGIPPGVMGLEVIIKAIFSPYYGIKFTVLDISGIGSNVDVDLIRTNKKGSELRIWSNYNLLELVESKCRCNFYEREAYGCRCGRIVG